MDNSEKAILKTILYSDIFDYPLTESELWFFLVTSSRVTKETIAAKLKKCSKIQKVGLFYVIKGREHIVALRKSRVKINQQKMQRAGFVASLLFFIPTVFFIGVSGGVAMQNAASDDDIDFFVIVKKNTVWISRFLLVVVLHCLGIYRKRGASAVADKVCLNMIIDEEALAFSKKRQDIYTAHEIVQLVPLIDRYDTYRRFRGKNIWIKKYMAHADMGSTLYRQGASHGMQRVGSWCLSRPWVESLARLLQEWIMKRHKTSETVTKNMLAFHPIDYRIDTLQRFKERVHGYV